MKYYSFVPSQCTLKVTEATFKMSLISCLWSMHLTFYHNSFLYSSNKPLRTHTHRFLFHPHRDTGKIFHRKMDVLAFEHRAIHHTSLFFPSDTEGKTRGVCDQCALWHLNMSERWNMSVTASSGQGWLGGRGWEKGRRGRITAEPEVLRIAEYRGKPRWSH